MAGPARPRMYHFLCPLYMSVAFLILPLSSGGSGGKEKRELNYDGGVP